MEEAMLAITVSEVSNTTWLISILWCRRDVCPKGGRWCRIECNCRGANPMQHRGAAVAGEMAQNRA
jgi:hypothetical protein